MKSPLAPLRSSGRRSSHKGVLVAAATALSLVFTIGLAAPAGAAASTVQADDPVPLVVPTPQSISTVAGGPVAIGGPVTLVVDGGSDVPAVELVKKSLTAAGINVTEAAPGAATSGKVVRIGPATRADISSALGDTAVPSRAEGYALVVGDNGVTVGGVDGAGQFYGAQTLAQLVELGTSGAGVQLARVKVSDFPSMALRGTIEGFYGEPWSQADRLDQIGFYGTVKMNTYIYAPKDDPFHRENWRTPYPADKVADLKALVTEAQANHVRFTFAISPGNTICYNGAADRTSLTDKFQQMYDIGVRAFYVALDDINLNRTLCAEDQAVYGNSGAAASAKGQRDLLNFVQRSFVATHPGVFPLQTVPTEYSDVNTSTYKQNFVTGLDPAVVIQWTGTDVVPPSIKIADAQKIDTTWGRNVYLWDNYPVNDFGMTSGRLHLAPYDKRDAGLSTYLQGIVSNPMNQAAASKPVIAGVAGFTWNDAKYNPEVTWQWEWQQLSDNASTATALALLGDLSHYASTFGSTPWQPQAPRLAALTAPVLAGLNTSAGNPAAEAALREYANAMVALPTTLRGGVNDPLFLAEADSWISAAGLWGQALVSALDGLAATHAGNRPVAVAKFAESKGFVKQANALRVTPALNTWGSVAPKIADGVLDTFLTAAQAATVPDPVLPAGVVNYWPMDETSGSTVRDVISGFDGTLSQTGSTLVPAKVNGGASLSGTGSQIQVDGSDLPLPWTVGMWVKPTAVRPLTESSALMDGAAVNSNHAVLKLQQWSTGKLGITVPGVADYSVEYTAAKDQWVYLTYVASAGKTVVFADGVKVGTINRAAALGRTWIGRSPSADPKSDRAPAVLDDIIVYNTALTDEAATALAASATRTKPAAQATVSLTRSASGAVKAGDTVTYQATIASTGLVGITDITVTDSLADTFGCTPPASLAPGASLDCTINHVVTAAEATGSDLVNLVTVAGFAQSPLATPLTAKSDPVIVTTEGQTAPRFSDVPEGSQFFTEIEWLAAAGVTSGYPDGTFKPGAPVERQALAAFLYRLSEDTGPAPACTVAPYPDVPVSSKFCGAIAWLKSQGITSGWPDGTFRPGAAIERQAMASFLYRWQNPGRTAPGCTAKPFVDVGAGNIFCGAIEWLKTEGIAEGFPDGSYHPGATIDRQAMAAFLYRIEG